MSKEYEEKRGPRGADEHTEKRFPRERRAEERVPVRERDAGADGLIEGRNAVTEALRAGTPIDKIFIARGETDKTLGHIASTARAFKSSNVCKKKIVSLLTGPPLYIGTRCANSNGGNSSFNKIWLRNSLFKIIPILPSSLCSSNNTTDRVKS